MEKLPQEILHKIVECQSRKSLHNIRSVNKSLSSAAAPFLFHTIPLWISLESLDALSHISEHPLLAGYVRKVVFSPLRFIERRDESALRALVRDALEYSPMSQNAHAISLGKYMASYKRYIELQRYLASESLAVKILSRAFAKLPQFEILDVDAWSSIASKRLFEDFGDHKGIAICTSDSEDTMSILFRALSSSSTRIKSFKLGHSEDFSENDLHPNHRPLNDSNKSNLGALIRTFREPDKLRCREVLSDLRNLEITDFDSPIRVSLATRDMVSRAIREIIRYSFKMESIVIGGLEFDDFADTPKPFFNDFVTPYDISHLNTLKLGLCQSKIDDFVSFFRLRAADIRHVELYEVTITDADWSTVLARLRDTKFLKLEDFILTYCIDCIDDLCARDYIVRRTDVDPIQQKLENFKAAWIKNRSQC
ncbi:hypothetical protein N7G274_007752 [Stereocaulon virgatum]|uniref:F-box domain-containing protein n=1 Tax=Stereocaulon virgatum TaxID=373712 RepID=A0ABR4A336_9LECA